MCSLHNFRVAERAIICRSFCFGGRRRRRPLFFNYTAIVLWEPAHRLGRWTRGDRVGRGLFGDGGFARGRAAGGDSAGEISGDVCQCERANGRCRCPRVVRSRLFGCSQSVIVLFSANADVLSSGTTAVRHPGAPKSHPQVKLGGQLHFPSSLPSLPPFVILAPTVHTFLPLSPHVFFSF